MRLERRFMLSGDFGEEFEVDDDDDFEELEHFESSDDDYESDDHDDDDHEDEAEERGFSFFVARESSEPSASVLIQQEVEEETEDTSETILDSDDSTEESFEEIESSFEEQPLASTADAVEANVESAIAVLAGANSTLISIKPASNNIVNETRPSTSPDFGTQDVNSSPRDARELYLPQESAKSTESQGPNVPLAIPDQSPSVASVQIRQLESADAASLIPFQADSSEHDELNSTVIQWLGSFADDLSAVDEALAELLTDTQSVAQASLASVLEHGPLVAGLATAGVAASAAYQRKRNQHSLQDDHYAVRFDVRMYPELFG